MVGRILCLCVVLTSLATARAASVEGDFDCYPIQPIKHAVPTAIRGSDRLTRSDSDDLLWAISRNRMEAAGHFILAEVGCGTDCIRLASVDVLTGDVRWMPKTISSWPIKMLQPVLYRNNSRLVVIFGQLDERGSAGPFRYLLAADGFGASPKAPVECGSSERETLSFVRISSSSVGLVARIENGHPAGRMRRSGCRGLQP